jgi:hypothetical protein
LTIPAIYQNRRNQKYLKLLWEGGKIMTDTITIELTNEHRAQAYIFAKNQKTPDRAKEVYENTLAILAIKNLLDNLGINNDLSQGFSWNFLGQQIGNIADLYLPDFDGFVECRVIHKTESKCHIPQDIQSDDKLGYLFVELDETYKTAEILGFIEQVSVSELPRSYFQSLDRFLENLESRPVNSELVKRHLETIKSGFTDWISDIQNLGNIIKDEYQLSMVTRGRTIRTKEIITRFRQMKDPTDQEASLIQVIETTQDNNELWEAGENLWQLLSKQERQHPYCPIIVAKDLSDILHYPLALMVGIMNKPHSDKMLIMIRVFPLESEQLLKDLLPQDLKLTITDLIENEIIRTVESQQSDVFIQYKFLADVEDKFSVTVHFSNNTFTQEFLV